EGERGLRDHRGEQLAFLQRERAWLIERERDATESAVTDDEWHHRPRPEPCALVRQCGGIAGEQLCWRLEQHRLARAHDVAQREGIGHPNHPVPSELRRSV